MRDPRGHRVLFNAPERFPHLIELKEPNGKTDVRDPKIEVEKIRSGEKDNTHFGGYHPQRAWIPATIKFPTDHLRSTTDPTSEGAPWQ
jgi:hypothetical protein